MKIKVLLLILILSCIVGCKNTANNMLLIDTTYGKIAFSKMSGEILTFSDSIKGEMEIMPLKAITGLYQISYSPNGEFIVGLSKIDDPLKQNIYAHPPALVDVQTGEVKQCTKFGDLNSIAYFGLQDGHDWGIGATSNLIYLFDFSTCELVEELIELEENNLFMGLSWNPKARMLAYGVHLGRNFAEANQEYQLHLYDFENGTSKIIAEGLGPAWSPDGTKIAYFSENGISVINLRTDEITTVNMGYRSIEEDSINWTADGDGFLFCVLIEHTDGIIERGIYYYSVNTTEPELLMIGGGHAFWFLN